MATLAIAAALLVEFSQLEERARKRVASLASQFQQMSAQELRSTKGIHLERHKRQKDPRARTIRIDDNHRGIVCDVGDDRTFILTAIGTHDETDHWIANSTFRVNPATGALEVLNVAAVDAAIEAIGPRPTTAVGIFAHRKDREFQQLGIEPGILPTLRAFTNEDELQGLLGVLPIAQADALILLTGHDSTDQIYAEIAGSIDPSTIDVDDIGAALAAPASRSSFHVVVDDDELAEMLARPLAQWRTYLHHTQQDAAYRRIYKGPARITGGPGTGKTVVAMHRAAALAQELQDRESRSILFTTFTRNLARAIEDDLRLLGGSDLLDVTEVLNVDRLAYRIVRDHEGSGPNVASSDTIHALSEQIVDEMALDLRPEFIIQEWEQVILAQDINSRDAYFNAPRSGRGTRLDRRGRAQMWRAVEELERHLVDKGERTHLQLASDAAGYLKARTVKPYLHIIVDEAQDLHQAQWRLLRAAVAPGANDLFLVGDSHQRIYDRHSSLSKVGIEIRGRSRRLRINYRTTHEILGWSLALLGEGDFDDLDTGFDTNNYAGYHSFLHGPRPTMSGHRSRNGMLDALTTRVRTWIDDGVSPESIGIAARASSSFDSVKRAMADAGIALTDIGSSGLLGDGVRLGTMHRFKGLEFRCVAVVDVDADKVPASWDVTPAAIDEVQNRLEIQRERCLLYVACTRARDDLWLGWSGNPSPFLGAMA